MKVIRSSTIGLPEAATVDFAVVVGKDFTCKKCGSTYRVERTDLSAIRYGKGHFATSCPTCGAECFIPVTRWQAVRNFFRR